MADCSMSIKELFICILHLTVVYTAIVHRDFKYAIMVDAGSSGSRVFVYTWGMESRVGSGLHNPVLLIDSDGKSAMKKIKPGLSSFAENPEGAKRYLSELLEFAKDAIPEVDHNKTSFYIFATAGMRLLTENTQEKIWNAVREVIKEYPFAFADNHAVTITGDDEALYGWIAVNYLLDRFSPAKDFDRKSTNGMLDLGGASMQIAFEITSKEPTTSKFVKRFSLKSKCKEDEEESLQDYTVYLRSYLNYGANQMRQRYEQVLLSKNLPGYESCTPIVISNPCLQRSLTLNASLVPRKVGDHSPVREDERKYQVQFTGGGNPDKCEEEVRAVVLRGEMSKGRSPPIDFVDSSFYGLTEFVYALDGVIAGEIYSYAEAAKKIAELCKMPWDKYTELLRTQYTDEKKFNEVKHFKKEQCFKSTLIVSLLHDGLKFPKEYGKLHRVNDIRNIEVQWTTGAIFFMLNAVPIQQNCSICQTLIIVISVCIVVLLILCVSAVYAYKRIKRSSRSVVQVPTLNTSQTSQHTTAQMQHHMKSCMYHRGSIEDRTTETIIQAIPV